MSARRPSPAHRTAYPTSEPQDSTECGLALADTAPAPPWKYPYKDLLPPLSTAEREALRASIEAEGIRDPVIVDEQGNVLDGHHRLEIEPNAPVRVASGLTDPEKTAFVFQTNLARRNLSPDQKKAVAGRMKATAKRLREEDPQTNTQARVAALLGVSQQTVSDWFRTNTGAGIASETRPDARVKVAPKHKPVIARRVEAGESQAQVAADYGVSQRTVSTIARQVRAVREQRQTREEAAAKIGDDTLGVHHGDFRKLGSVVADGSVDLLFTDPPYLHEDLEIFGDLGEFAARVLRPGGWLLSYVGVRYLPIALDALSEHLTYGWTFAVRHTAGDARFRTLNIYNGWKPITAFYKPPLEAWWGWFRDIVSGGREKSDHPWQQAEAEAAYFIKALSPEGGLVCDPFTGSGTTLAAAQSLGRRLIGFEIDAKHVKTARVRLVETKSNGWPSTGAEIP